jgi:acyl transferase domain-containing protein/3-hydroxymyristoyl/3-hydroxydecanoyl-(acyl carrier protein) dehydratase/1-acyl-sn-glycerol-3-phosphate acyltransferase
MFEPIAIVGRSCLLPEAASPDELWALVIAGRSAISTLPPGRWRAAREQVLTTPEAIQAGGEGCVTDRGGFVQGFEKLWRPQDYNIDAAVLGALDPLVHWLLYTGRAALTDAGIDVAQARGERIGAIVGNLAYPTERLVDLAAARLMPSRDTPHPLNRFSTGLPVHLMCSALGLGAGGHALDAACASSIYAIKLSCDWLHSRRADVMLAGGTNRCDSLIIHAGFSALRALSPSGRSRPFHRDADGLVPAEGAAFVVLKRLADAERDGDRIFGVIRGIGLSNDGRGGSLLAPAEAGQVRAMREAFRQCGLEPSDISLVECHATGTALGDAAELRSMSEVYASAVAIGSLKSNLGHLVTASGLAGLIKVLEALRHEVKPATLDASPATDALAATPFRLLAQAEPWPKREVRRAAISSFGFGGNNAHMLIEDYVRQGPTRSRRGRSVPASGAATVAVVGIGAQVGDGHGVDDFARSILVGESRLVFSASGPTGGAAEHVRLPGGKLAAPPRDMVRALGQQTMLMAAVEEALRGVTAKSQRTSVFVGMQCDAEGTRSSLRLSLKSDTSGRDDIERALDAARVVGCMGNVPANRINRQYGFEGPSFTFFAEELSGIHALDAGIAALARGEADMVVVGATDLCVEAVHAAAAQAALTADRRVPGDAACALVLKRADDAGRDGDDVMAHIEQPAFVGAAGGERGIGRRIRACFGHAHAASGLLEVMGAVLALDRRAMPADAPTGAKPLLPRPSPHHIDIGIDALGEQHATVRIVQAISSGARPNPAPLTAATEIRLFAGATPVALREAVVHGRSVGPAAVGENDMRLVLVGSSAEMNELLRQADRFLAALPAAGFVRAAALPEGVFYHPRPIKGETALVFTGAAAAYAGMGRDLVLAFPHLVQNVSARCADVEKRAGWVYAAAPDTQPNDFEQLCGTSFLCQLHAEFTRRMLKVEPDAVIGLSSGETNALFALGLWQDMGGLLDDVEASGLYTEVLGGRAAAIHTAWAERGISAGDWANHRVVAPAAMVEQAVAEEPAVHITIINAPDDYVIGGEAEACERVIAKIGRSRAAPLPMRLAVHCSDARPAAEMWRRLHHRPVTLVPQLRVYGNAYGRAYTPTADSVAEALTAQAIDRIDFPRTILQAWQDGVRIFIEHGPRAQCTQSIRSILGDRPHLAVALDSPGRNSLRQAMYAAGELLAAGLDIDLAGLRAALHLASKRQTAQPALVLPAHPPAIPSISLAKESARPAAPRAQVMGAAPALAPPVEPLSPLRVRQTAPAQPARVAAVPPLITAERGGGRRSQTLGVIAAIHARMTTEHTAYLARATELSGQFRRLQSFQAPAGRPALREPLRAATPKALVAAPVYAPVLEVGEPHGPKFSRADLERLASGRISEVFGPRFVDQDHYERQVRMPMPPLLLADRVLGLAGEPGSMDRGTIWTETDVTPGAWYLHHGRMPAGIAIEAGQADLLLASWLGADLRNRGQRIYRLLGCDLTFHEGLPKVGETLRYDIHVDSHARLGDIGMFFFHYDARVDGALRLTVRSGQAGFFTDTELASSEGVLWSAKSTAPTPLSRARLDACPQISELRHFDSEAVRAFHEGQVRSCFGPGFERGRLHTRTPRSPSGQMRLLNSVPVFEPTGGPWGRGYLRAEWPVSPRDWFFDGHFKNDPCMPGTLMFEACLQAMAFAITGLGFTLDRDGWRFEPVPEQTYQLRCRGQVTPASSKITYEVFIDEIVAGPLPTLFADVLATVDGLKAFHCARLGLRLVPDWPLEENARIAERPGAKPAATALGITFDSHSLLACATGRPSTAFGPIYERFDGPIRIPRLPSPPYHFMTRVTHIEGQIGAMKLGSLADVEYDIPPDAWYFADNHRPTMPFCVLLEAMLQTCGWLASYVGCALETKADLFFRHLDGSGVVHAEVPVGARILASRVTLKSLSRIDTTSITVFTLEATADGVAVASFDTVFGNFPGSALANQVGIAPTDDERQWFVAESPPPLAFESVMPSLAQGKLRIIDRITGFWPTGGAQSLGRVRADKDLNGDEWFFKAHFFNDPVQPGSIGLDGVLQTIQAYMLATRNREDDRDFIFEPIATGETASWKCRGQVLPHNKRVTILVEIIENKEDDRGRTVIASGSLWVDGKKIYSVSRIGRRMLLQGAPETVRPSGAPMETRREHVLDPAVDGWLRDHRPTYTLPVLPLMSVVDSLAAAASATAGSAVIEVRDFSLNGWFIVDGPCRLQATVTQLESGSYDARLVSHALKSRPVTALGRITTADSYPPPPDRWLAPTGMPLVHDREDRSAPDIYETGELFHGPSFQNLVRLHRSPHGAVAILDAGPSEVPFGALNQRLLDGMVQAIPNDRLHLWFPSLPTDRIGYPSRIDELTFSAPPPRHGLVHCDVRPDGFADERRTAPRFSVQLSIQDQVFVQARIVYALFPEGPIGALPPRQRRAFLFERQHIPGVCIGRHDDQVTIVSAADFAGSDWLSGTLAAAYSLTSADPLRELAVKQHAGLIIGVHPATIDVSADGRSAQSRRFPLNVMPVSVETRGAVREVRGRDFPLDTSKVRAFWESLVGVPDWAMTDLYLALLARFVRRVEFIDPATRDMVAARPVLFLCNHQVGVESPLFSLAAGGATGRRVVTIAKSEHRTSWIGRLIEFAGSYPGARQPRSILHFDRQDANTFFDVLRNYREELKADGPSLMVHVEGTRALNCRTPVQRVSSVLFDLAAELQLPIVPVRFVGGLPVEPLARRIEFPAGLGCQDFVFGTPIMPEQIGRLPLVERSRLVCKAINGLPPANEVEQPFSAAGQGAGPGLVETESEVKRVLLQLLRESSARGDMTKRLLAVVDGTADRHDADESDPWVARLASWLAGDRTDRHLGFPRGEIADS